MSPRSVTQSYHRRANELCPPWGTQLLSKRPEQFAPDHWPSHFQKARGCEIWDLDDRRYLDFSTMSVGSCLLGYADPEVNAAVESCIKNGNTSSLNPPEEIDLAERLIDIHPWASGARFARSGGEAMAMAIRIARAKTNRSRIAACGYHGWHDWYLAANLDDEQNLDGHLLPGLQPRGVPRELTGTIDLFHYNRIEELEAIMTRQGDSVAAICMEPMRYTQPDPEFLPRVRALADHYGALLIFDEITAGWRFRFGGVHLDFGIQPDLAVFAKGISNGYPMAAVLGTTEAFSILDQCFISSSYWTERIGPTAALATIQALESRNIWPILERCCQRVADCWEQAASRHHIPVKAGNNPAFAFLTFTSEDESAAKTLYTQLMLEKGILSSTSFYASIAHEPELEHFHRAVDETFAEMAALQEQGWQNALTGPTARSAFQRLT